MESTRRIGYKEKISEQIAEYVYSKDQSTPVYKLKYAIRDTINYILFCIPLIICSAILSSVWNGIITIVAFSVLRRYSGGFHLATDTRCTVLSALMVIIAIYMPNAYWYNGFVENIVALVLIVIYAPSGSQAPKELHQKFKLIAIAMIAMNFILQSGLLANVFFVQALTTPTVLQRIVSRYKL